MAQAESHLTTRPPIPYNARQGRVRGQAVSCSMAEAHSEKPQEPQSPPFVRANAVVVNASYVVLNELYLKVMAVRARQMLTRFSLDTPKGIQRGEAGDWLVEGPTGQRWICPDDQFRLVYVARERFREAAQKAGPVLVGNDLSVVLGGALGPPGQPGAESKPPEEGKA